MRARELASPVPAPEPIPEHVAVIMDGNRRWAKARGLPVVEGYRRGIASLRELTRAAQARGVKVVTAFGFSTENWKRDGAEVSLLFELCCAFSRAEAPRLRREGVRVRVLGDIDRLPEGPRRALSHLATTTQSCSGLTLNLAVNYSGRAELVRAVRGVAADVSAGSLPIEHVDETSIAARLYTAGLPDPDLLIRPGGEFRISNFLLYQLAYTELWVTDVQWPDFSRAHFDEALVAFQSRQRRFGGR